MRLWPRRRLLAWFVFGACALTALTAATAWVAARGRLLDESPWLVACLLALAFAGWSTLYRSVATHISTTATAEIAALRALVASQDARYREIADSQGRFVGNIAHEIKTPLTLMLAQLDLLLRTSHDAAAVQNHGKSIGEDVRHLSDLVDSFLRLARPFGQADTSQHVPVDVHDFVMEAARRSQALARTSGVRIVLLLVEPEDGVPAPEVLGDATLLGAMLENLVRNAVRFSPRGDKVTVQVEARAATVLIRVDDHGTGVAAENRETVFDWFFQSPGLTLQSAGTGFGLAIAMRVAEHHGGTITLRAAPDHGCEFEITLPRYVTAAAAAAAAGPIAV